MKILPLWMVVLPLLASLPAGADETTLARLCFWVGPERMEEFEAAYEEKAAPVLRQLGLVASAQRGRATVDSVFSRLFELETPGEFLVRESALRHQATWREIVRELGLVFGAAPDSVLRFSFWLYSGPAGAGKAVRAGAGARQGLWQRYSAVDGLPDGLVLAIAEDRNGHLWFGTGGGVSRYDGTEFITYRVEEGLADNNVSSILEDGEGYLWFGTYGGGVSRYDGTEFVTYRVEEGLAGNSVSSILEDGEGYLYGLAPMVVA